jgi:copper chaperone CopZ
MTVSPQGPSTAILEVTGMHCASCAALISETLQHKPGVEAVTVDLDAGRADVAFDSSATNLDDICSTIAGLGYGASPALESGTT